MKLPFLLKLSFRSLQANRGRAFLTMLGIIIGIASVIMIISIGAGAQSLIFNQIKSIGSNLLGVLPGGRQGNEPPAAAFGIAITTLKYEDALALKDPVNVPHAVAVTPYVRGAGTAVFQNRTHDTSFTGVSADYINVEEAEVAKGDFFSFKEEKGTEKVAVLGSVVKDELFPDSNPIGRSIRIKNVNFTVIGYIKPRGSAGFQNQDDQIFIPVTTAQKIMLGIHHVGFIRVKVDKPENIQVSAKDVETTLRIRHNIKDPADDDFFVGSQEMMLSILGQITNIISFLLAAIAAVSLLVGGIGIMNIMFVSVNERTQEIGLRKAIGARRKDILLQFLLESIALTIVGGVLGILIGALIALLVAIVANYLGYNWDFVISIFAIFISVTFCTLIGISFGYFPAKRASGLSPIEALRYE